MMAKFSGANLIHDVGYMESGLTTSFEMIVLTDELIAMTDHLIKGIRVDDETLMVEEIDAVGPGGQFIGTEATLKHFREFWFPGLLDRKTRPNWLKAGATTLGQRLNTKVKEIISEYRSPELPAEKKHKIDEILANSSNG
jgi:trimethylamine--corrinoid protein Co-methyltransferase